MNLFSEENILSVHPIVTIFQMYSFAFSIIFVLCVLYILQIMEVNVKASFFLCKEVVPHMEKRG